MDAATQKMIANLEAKTGRSMKDWVALARGSTLPKHGALVKWLKAEQGLTHGYANLVAHTALGSAASTSGASDTELVDAQYQGKKAALRPIYDALMAKISAFGGDVELAPKKAYVSLRRSKQWGLIQPSTATRMDIGLVLKGVEPTDRLEAAGSWNTMVTHRVRLTAATEVDAELVGWLKQAYRAG